jgi:hypothetical protein
MAELKGSHAEVRPLYTATQPAQEPDTNEETVTYVADVLEGKKHKQRPWVGLTDEEMQTEQDCVGWFGYDTGLRLWFEADKGDEGAIPLYKARGNT